MATKTNGVALRGFYRPHARVTEDGRMVNPATGEITYPPSRTKQEFQAECDINNILKQFSATGMLRHVSAKASAGAYQDLPDAVDFQDGLHTVQRATDAFMTLPSKLRARFGNDPVEFLGFCADPANAEELLSLGLRNPVSVITPTPVVVINSTPSTSSSSSPPASSPGPTTTTSPKPA